MKVGLTFLILEAIVLFISCWPGVFDLSNHIFPLIFGVPFCYMWQIFLAYVTVVLIIINFFVDKKNGDHDFELDEDYDYLQDRDLLDNDDLGLGK